MHSVTDDLGDLQAKIAELEAELAKRPVVYVKITGGTRAVAWHGPTLYVQKEVDGYLGQSAFEPYTGEQE